MAERFDLPLEVQAETAQVRDLVREMLVLQVDQDSRNDVRNDAQFGAAYLFVKIGGHDFQIVVRPYDHEGWNG